MSIIPWITEGDDRTVVKDPHDFKLDGEAILVLNFDEKEIQRPENTNVSYDLRVGENYVMYHDRRMRALNKKNNIIRIPPGEAAIIYTFEQVHFPERVFGLIVPRYTLLRDGLSNTPTKVDPGYGVGPLHITVFNHGMKPFELNYLQCFCALCLFQVGKGVRARSKGTIGIPITPGNPRWPKLRRWVQTNWLMIILAVAAFGGLILNIITGSQAANSNLSPNN